MNDIIAEIRREAPERSDGSLQNTTRFPDSLIISEIRDAEHEIEKESGEEIAFDKNDAAAEARRYLSFIRCSYLVRSERGPKTISHVRRYNYDNQQLLYWRDEMIRALKGV